MTGLFDDLAMPKRVRSNHLLYGDNLTIMQNMPTACVDLIYLDPPFNSQRTYNLIYKQLTGLPLPEQEEAFCDAWEMDPEKEEMARRMPIVLRDYGAEESLVRFWDAWIKALRNTQPKLLAYLIYMTYRLFEMRRVLRPTGSIYFHCDPTASHYVKVILDGIFGHDNFRGEIIWRRTNARGTVGRWPRLHDVILHYSRGAKFTFHPLRVKADAAKMPHTLITGPDGKKYQTYELTAPGVTKEGESGRPWRGYDPGSFGRHWANDEATREAWDAAGLMHWPARNGFPRRRAATPFDPASREVVVGDVWTDIDRINQSAGERLGYPTQKPVALLERIINASTNPGEVVFDPFCGCGTTIYAAQKAGRSWIGCDIAIWSVRIVRDVLLKRHGVREGVDYQVNGVPLTVEGARDLFERDPRQFQHWVTELVGGFPSTKHSGDRGIDGSIYYETANGLRRMVLSVKGGKLSPAFVRELRGTMERERDTDMAGFICLQEPTRGMMQEVADAGMFKHGGRQYPRLQIRTVADLLNGKGFDTPSRVETLQKEKQAVLAL